jgi:solute:Na+ symporter, SSS family
MISTRWIDLVIILAYMGALVAMGLRFSRRQTSTEHYFTAKRTIPAWAMGLSFLANLSSDLNSLAAVGVEDYYRRWNPHSGERQRLMAAKVLVALAGGLCILLAIRLAHTGGNALSLWYTVSAIVAGGLAGLFLLAFLSERASETAAYIGIAASLLFTAWATLTVDSGKIWNLGAFNFPLHTYMIGVIGHLVLLAVGYAASLLFPNQRAGSGDLTLWGWLRSLHAVPSVLETHQI